jgi:hypothetical protein
MLRLSSRRPRHGIGGEERSQRSEMIVAWGSINLRASYGGCLDRRASPELA